MSPQQEVNSRLLHNWRRALSQLKYSFKCPLCQGTLFPGKYEKHCLTVHRVDPKTRCVWCRVVSWPKGEKARNSDHLWTCARKCIQRNQIREPTASPTLRLLDSTPEFPERDTFGVELDVPDNAHEPLWPPVLEPYPDTYRNAHLNLAIAYVRLYLQTKNTHDFYHVMVRSVAWTSFVRALNEDAGATQTLLFFTWCDGGKDREARFRQHRHGVVTCQKGRFRREVWPKVEPAERPRASYACKKLKAIESPEQFANTLRYLAGRRSQCRFSFEGEDKRAPKRNLHVCMNRTLPTDHRLPLFASWEGGMTEHLKETVFDTVSLARVVLRPFVFARGQWTQKLRDYPDLERGLVLPVRKGLAPTRRTTRHVVHLVGGRKLYFGPSSRFAAMSDATWLERQAEAGNRLYDEVEEETWIPRPKFQKQLNLLLPAMENNARLTTENARLTTENALITADRNAWKRKAEEKDAELQAAVAEKDTWKRKCEEHEAREPKKLKLVLSVEQE